MKRRTYLGSLTSIIVTSSLSGCSFFTDSYPETIPTKEQEKYIEYYPHHSERSNTASLSVFLSDEGVIIAPNTFGVFTAFEIYNVNPNGSGDKIGEILKDEAIKKTSRPTRVFDMKYVTSGSVLLILCVLPNNTKYTYGAYYKPKDRDVLQQVAYVPEHSPTTTPTSTSESTTE